VVTGAVVVGAVDVHIADTVVVIVVAEVGAPGGAAGRDVHLEEVEDGQVAVAGDRVAVEDVQVVAGVQEAVEDVRAAVEDAVKIKSI
jgi:hypothetical protein